MIGSRGVGVGRVVVCGMSGGVDSAVAAALLQRQGLQVIGAHMQNWDEQDEAGDCMMARENDLNDARDACSHLKIPFITVSFVKEYWNQVFSALLTDYERGLTPNPDVLCNRYLKFGSFYKYATKELGADFIATGHYALTSSPLHHEGKVRLRRALDVTKDQTLFLSSIHQQPLQRTLFPLGNLYKVQVRQLAHQMGMQGLAKKRDSVGICFIGDRSFTHFISEYIQNRPGNFVDLDTGQVIGSHLGVHHWTIGQRCRISGTKMAYYVAARDPQTQVIYAVTGRDHPALYTNLFWAKKPHWICDIPHFTQDEPYRCMFKFQHTEWTIPALIFKCSKNVGSVKVWLSISTRAITPGQQAVFYHKDVCLGSAKIIWTAGLSALLGRERMRGQEERVAL